MPYIRIRAYMAVTETFKLIVTAFIYLPTLVTAVLRTAKFSAWKAELVISLMTDILVFKPLN